MFYNDKQIPIKNFKDYMKMFVGDDSELFTEKINDNFEIGISKSLDGGFNQVSIVNGITTYNGGTHVNVIINDLTKKTQEILAKKYKKLNIKSNDIKNNTFVFVSAKISNPSFDTQTKETLTSKINGDVPLLSDKIIKQFSSSQIVDEVIRFLNIKEQVDTKKEIGKHKIKISKLDDAKKAGTYDSDKCTIFITEGDSAHSSVLAGFSEINSDYYGAYPLRGKILNVRDVNLQKIRDNEELKNLINILGLEFGKKYTDTSKLRYGKVALMADADCIDENSLILTKRGHIPIKDITYEDEVLTHNNEWKKIKNIIRTNKENSIDFTINGEIYTFGENHEIPMLRNNEIKLIKAKDILMTDKFLKRKGADANS